MGASYRARLCGGFGLFGILRFEQAEGFIEVGLFHQGLIFSAGICFASYYIDGFYYFGDLAAEEYHFAGFFTCDRVGCAAAEGKAEKLLDGLALF